jgi:hypothetical protein
LPDTAWRHKACGAAGLRATAALKRRRSRTDNAHVSSDKTPLQYLNGIEQRLFGWFVLRMFASKSARFERALAETGPHANARMACVNALRGYAICFFLVGLAGELLRSSLLTYPLMVLAMACMAWSFWCLYTVVGPEREYKRANEALKDPQDPAHRLAGHTG